MTRVALLHGVTFTPERAEGSLHGEGCLQRRARIPLNGEDYLSDVQAALCTSANRLGADLYIYIYWTHVPPMLQMASFGTILDNLRPKVAQMLQMVSYDTFLDYFGLMASNFEFRAQACPVSCSK